MSGERRSRGVAMLVAWVIALTACGSDTDQEDQMPGTTAAAQALDRQRIQVRAAAEETVAALVRAAAVRVHHLNGDWRGCHSAKQWEYRDYEYAVAGRLDLPPDAASAQTTIINTLEELGYGVEQQESDAGTASYWGPKDSVVVTITFHTGRGFALVGFSPNAGCIELPKAERPHWQGRHDPDGAIDVTPPERTDPGSDR